MEKSNLSDSKKSVEIKRMLNRLFDIFLSKFKDTSVAWDNLIEFIAIDHSPNVFLKGIKKAQWLFEDKRFRDSVHSIYDVKLLCSVYDDFLGELYFEVFKKTNANKSLAYKTQAHIKTLHLEGKKPLKILDLDMGTGKNLMNLHQMDPKALLFGVTKDLNLYRIALTNSLLYNINSYLLHADSMVHELGLNNSRGLENWKKSNQWSYDISELKQNLN